MHAVVDTHGRFTEFSVVYTDNPVWLEHSIHIMELLLAEEKYKVVWFDLKYTHARVGSRPKVTVTHMCVQNHVLIYHCCLPQDLVSVWPGFSTSPTTCSLQWTSPMM